MPDSLSFSPDQQHTSGNQSNGSKQLVIWRVTLDKRVNWPPHIDQVRKKTAQMTGMLGPLLSRSDLSVRNAVLLCKRLIRRTMDYACPAWRSAARTHVWRPQVLQSKCLRLATNAPWYVSYRQIHEDLGVPLFADHVRALTATFDSRLADVGNPLLRQIGTYLRYRGLTPSTDAKAKGGRGQQASRDHRPRWPIRLNESPSALIRRAPFGYPD